MAFKKAVKYDAKGRVALVGPAGSGKSYTALILARELAGPDGKIAAIDTEHGSLSKYAPAPGVAADNKATFDFDVCELHEFTPDSFQTAMDDVEREEYAVFLCDSLSHFWMGKGGALEFVDNEAKRSRTKDDSFAGWKAFRPHERAMVDRMIASSAHVICTMRTKNAYEIQEIKGKKRRVKIGLAPVQRDGLEYEFDLVGTMDDDNTFLVDKTRCLAYGGKALTKPKAKDFKAFKEWLAGAPAPTPPTTTHTKNPPPATAGEGGRQPAAGKPGGGGNGAPAANGNGDVPADVQTMWDLMRNFQASCEVFAHLKASISKAQGSNADYYRILGEYGMEHGNDLKGVDKNGKTRTRGNARRCARALLEHLNACKAAPAWGHTDPPATPSCDPSPYKASDDDLPAEVGGTWREPEQQPLEGGK